MNLFKLLSATIILILCLVVYPPSAKADEYRLTQRLFSWTTTLTVEKNCTYAGKMTEEFLSIGTNIKYLNPEGDLIARAEQSLFSWGYKYKIYNAENQLLYVVNEKVFKSFLGVYSEYVVHDAKGELVAVSDKREFITTNFEIKNVNGVVVASAHRPVSLIVDSWYVRTGAVDPLIPLFITAYKTTVDDHKQN